MSPTNWKTVLKDKSERQQAFLSRKEPGDLLVYLRGGAPGPRESIMRAVYSSVVENRFGHFPNRSDVEQIVTNHVREFRETRTADTLTLSDDSVPQISVHFDIGIQTAAMTDLEPWYAGECWWLEPSLDWEQIEELKFNPDNKWVQLLNDVNRTLWSVWDEDFRFLPFLHRSPLDAANGIRGEELFVEMYTHPDRVKRLVQWCVQCELDIEAFIRENSGRPEGCCANGHMNTWLPEGAVWVNGDPVALISRELMREFEQPYTAQLFTSAGGGFFHNHTKGLYQVDQVAETEGILIEQFTPDPKCPTVIEVLLNDPAQRDVILQASMLTPIYFTVFPHELEETLPILKEGRFILNVAGHRDEHDLNGLLRKVREAGNLF